MIPPLLVTLGFPAHTHGFLVPLQEKIQSFGSRTRIPQSRHSLAGLVIQSFLAESTHSCFLKTNSDPSKWPNRKTPDLDLVFLLSVFALILGFLFLIFATL